MSPARSTPLILELPNGTASVQAPTFHDMYITSVGGCVRLNNPNNGFTNDSSSQEYMTFPRFTNVTCSANTIGLQCSKCFTAKVIGGQWNATSITLDFEGSDDVLIDGVFITGSTDLPVKFNTHSTFGNNDTLTHSQILCPNADANGIACVYTSARNANIVENYMECQGSFAVLPQAIEVDTNNLHTKIQSNTIDCSSSFASHGLVYNGDPYLLDWSNNGSSGVPYPSALFNSGSGVQYWINPTNSAQVFHHGNSNEGGFPFSSFNNFPEVQGQQTTGLLAAYTPGGTSINVNNTNYGATVLVSGGAFILPSGTQELDFNQEAGLFTGTLDVCVLWNAVSGSPAPTMTVYDGASSEGTANPTLTSALVWSCVSNVAYSTGATAKIVSASSGGSVNIYEVTIRQHGV